MSTPEIIARLEELANHHNEQAQVYESMRHNTFEGKAVHEQNARCHRRFADVLVAAQAALSPTA